MAKECLESCEPCHRDEEHIFSLAILGSDGRATRWEGGRAEGCRRDRKAKGFVHVNLCRKGQASVRGEYQTRREKGKR